MNPHQWTRPKDENDDEDAGKRADGHSAGSLLADGPAAADNDNGHGRPRDGKGQLGT